MTGGFEGKVVLVTGGSSGIGRATALAFAGAGAQVVVADIGEAGSVETVQLITQAGGAACFVRADVTQAAEVEALVAATVARYGRLDCAFNNAGVEGPALPAGEYSEADWRRIVDVNLTGVWLCLKYEAAQMIKQGGGAIVNNASALGLVGMALSPAYVASKHGVVGLTKAAALDYATQGIRVNAVCPGFVDTPMLERSGLTTDPQRQKYIVGLHPAKRLGRGAEVAAAVLWLASDAASFVTGAALSVDGGFAAR